jgi:hypothetical protein
LVDSTTFFMYLLFHYQNHEGNVPLHPSHVLRSISICTMTGSSYGVARGDSCFFHTDRYHFRFRYRLRCWGLRHFFKLEKSSFIFKAWPQDNAQPASKFFLTYLCLKPASNIPSTSSETRFPFCNRSGLNSVSFSPQIHP